MLTPISYLFGQLTGLVGGVQNLIVKNGEIESKSQPDRMRRLHLVFGYVESLLIRLLGLVYYRLNHTQTYINVDHKYLIVPKI